MSTTMLMMSGPSQSTKTIRIDRGVHESASIQALRLRSNGADVRLDAPADRPQAVRRVTIPVNLRHAAMGLRTRNRRFVSSPVIQVTLPGMARALHSKACVPPPNPSRSYRT
jgi:hypothetical protein